MSFPETKTRTQERTAEGLNRMQYLEAQNALLRLEKKGFPFQSSGIEIPIRAEDSFVAASALTRTLNSNMNSLEPHFFVTLHSMHGADRVLSHVGRMMVSGIGEPYFGLPIIAHELISKRAIRFIDAPPWCVYESPNDEDLVSHEFLDAMKRRVGRNTLYSGNTAISILAGIGKIDQERALPFGSEIVNLARLSIAMEMWNALASDKPFFILSTTRLANEFPDVPPQAYLLNRLYTSLGMHPKWLGLCAAHESVVRDVDTGAVMIQIRMKEYERMLISVQKAYITALQRMQDAKSENKVKAE